MSTLLLPTVIGHRGAARYAPENTLAGLHTAADMGLEWVEVDIMLTRDGVPILFHDEKLNRTSSGAGLVADMDWKDIQELDAGSWFGDSFIGEPIPGLEQAIEVMISRGLCVNLEIKPCPGREKETAEVMLDLATRIWPEDRPQPLISSFQHVSLETALDLAPGWPRGYLVDNRPDNWLEMVEYLEASSINFNGRKASRTEVEDYIETGKPVAAYTINEPMRAQELRRWGVDCFFSDVPDVIREAIGPGH